MKKLNVYYNDRLVGTLAQYNRKYAFQYDDEWILNGFSISPFSLPLKNNVFIPNDNTFNGFFGVFADSMPDAWGNLIIDRFLKKENIIENDGLVRLSIIGKSGMGALEYMPNYELKKDIVFDLDLYQEEADKILNKKDTNIDLLFKYGGSSGGARPKALLNLSGEDWIVKFQSSYDMPDFGLCEYEYAKACEEIGIKIPEVKLLPSKTNSGYFAVKRFDRDNGHKIHMISAAALLEVDFRSPCLDYNDLFKLTRILTNDCLDDLKELFLRMCFNVYAHNLDDHAKNFSFIYDEKSKTYRLSKAYDMTFSNTYYNEHTTSVNGKGKNIEDIDLITVGKKIGLNDIFMEDSIKLVKEVVNRRLIKYLK